MSDTYTSLMKSLGIVHCPDMVDHIDVLSSYAGKCESVTEFGFRGGCSFAALLSGKPKKATTYDLRFNLALVDRFKALNMDVSFKQADTATCNIENTDLLFIDSLHTYAHLSKELSRHADKVKNYLIFHDVVTFGSVGEDGQKPGLRRAILEFMYKNRSWKVDFYNKKCNGLLVLANESVR